MGISILLLSNLCVCNVLVGFRWMLFYDGWNVLIFSIIRLNGLSWLWMVVYLVVRLVLLLKNM